MPAELALDLRLRLGALSLDVQLDIARGPVALVGPNGAGKTSLLRLLAGGLQPDQGRAVVRGRTLVDAAAGTCLPPEARRVGYLPQHCGLFPHLSVQDNVAYGIRAGDRRQQARALLDGLGVGHLARRWPRGLSGGEAQRVALARALGTAPELLLLDEPTAALDVLVRREVRGILHRHLHDPARCAVVVTHDLRDLLAWQPTVVLMEQGRVSAVGSVAQLQGLGHPFLDELLAVH